MPNYQEKNTGKAVKTESEWAISHLLKQGR
jgi:hypothetical protein